LSITKEQKQHANTILVALYGSSMDKQSPTEKTVVLLAKMLKEIAKCNKSINDLLSSLSSTTGSGWAFRIVKAGANLAKNDKSSFKLCSSYTKNLYKSPLLVSMM
jgi:hypothetical protein